MGRQKCRRCGKRLVNIRGNGGGGAFLTLHSNKSALCADYQGQGRNGGKFKVQGRQVRYGVREGVRAKFSTY